MAVKGLQQHRPARKWRDPIKARGVRRRRVTSAGVVRGLECYNVTIATGRFRLKRWNVTFYHRRRKRVLYVERNRTTCRLVMYLRKVTKQQAAFGGFIGAKDVRIHGFVGIYPPGKFVTGSFWLTRITWDPALWSSLTASAVCDFSELDLKKASLKVLSDCFHRPRTVPVASGVQMSSVSSLDAV